MALSPIVARLISAPQVALCLWGSTSLRVSRDRAAARARRTVAPAAAQIFTSRRARPTPFAHAGTGRACIAPTSLSAASAPFSSPPDPLTGRGLGGQYGDHPLCSSSYMGIVAAWQYGDRSFFGCRKMLVDGSNPAPIYRGFSAVLPDGTPPPPQTSPGFPRPLPRPPRPP